MLNDRSSGSVNFGVSILDTHMHKHTRANFRDKLPPDFYIVDVINSIYINTKSRVVDELE